MSTLPAGRPCAGAYLLLILLLPAAAWGQAAPDDFTERPALWTCGAEDWGPNEARMNTLRENVAVGEHAVVLNYTHGYEHYLVFPKWRNANWDLTGVDHLVLRIKQQPGTSFHRSPTLYLRNQDGPFIRIRPADRATLLGDDNDGEWRTIRIPLHGDDAWERIVWLDGTLKDVDFIEVAFMGSGYPNGAAHHVMVDGVHFSPTQPDYTPPNENAGDLDVLLIERTPLYERYDLAYEPSTIDPTVRISRVKNDDAQHQPTPGETITYTARVQNKGRAPLAAQYRWVLDGETVATGQLDELAPRAKASTTWQWQWDPADHDLRFELRPAGEDYCPLNNTVEVRTNALLLKFQVERGLIARMESKVNMLGSRSCEDWLQGQLRFMNQLFAASTYDFAPQGITQRVAVGKIEYVDDGYLPTLGGGPYRVGELDLSVDGGRGLTALDDPWNSGAGAPCFLNFIGRPDGAWLHELSHQIGVIDDYQFIIEPEGNAVNGVGFNYKQRGLMGGGEVYPHQNIGMLYCVYAPSDVQGLNATKGKRRGYFGEYLYCLPQQCVLQLTDERGRPLADVPVRCYQAGSDRKIDDTAEHTGRTDARGRFTLTNRPADHLTTATDCTLHDNPFGPIHVVGMNGTMLVVTEVDGAPRYGFFTVADFNVAWAAGAREQGTVQVVVQPKGDERYYHSPRPLPAVQTAARGANN